MKAIKGSGTRPELMVVQEVRGCWKGPVHRNVRWLPGKPDLALLKAKTAVFVHGCFWHGHDCGRVRPPKTNRAYWDLKIERNRRRDARVERALRRMGWSVFTIWECRLAKGTRRVAAFLGRTGQAVAQPSASNSRAKA